MEFYFILFYTHSVLFHENSASDSALLIMFKDFP